METPAVILGALSAVGGCMGYYRKESVPSLVAGITFGALYECAAYLMKSADHRGVYLALASSVVLFLVGLSRAIPSRFMKPVGVVLTAMGAFGSLFYYGKL